jgi:hypothetical protein
MKTNVTLKLDAKILKEARVLAAEQGISISRLLADNSRSWCGSARATSERESAPSCYSGKAFV